MRAAVVLCAVLVAVAVVAVAASDDHAHAHDDHGHDHDHGHAHGHAHGGKSKYSQAANEPDHADHDHDDNHGHGHSHGAAEKEEPGHSHSHGHAHGHSGGDTGSNLSWTWIKAFLATGLISTAPVVFLLFIPIEKDQESSQGLLKVLLSFATGGLLGDAFLHLLPHASGAHDHGSEGHSHGHSHGHSDEGEHDHTAELWVGLFTLGGIMTFLIIEKFARAMNGGHGHSHGETVTDKKTDEVKPAEDDNVVGSGIKTVALLNLVGDFSHNFTDGLAIGASFLVDEKLALATVFTILLHEIPHEIGDFAILVKSGCSKRKAMMLQLTTAVGAMLGTLTGLISQNFGQATTWILPFTAGGFIYIATVSVIPELLHDSTLWQSVKEIAAMMLGVAIMVVIVFLE